MTVAYIRTYSDNQLLLTKQKETIEKFAEAEKLTIDKWCNECGSTPQKKKKIELLLKSMSEGDVLIISDISRLSRKLVNLLHYLLVCIEQNIVVYSVTEGYVFKENENTQTLSFVFSIVSEIEKKLISVRTKEALAMKRNKGVKLGRPKGSRIMDRLMKFKKQIKEKLNNENITIEELAIQYKVSVFSFKRFINDYIMIDEKTGEQTE